MSFLFVNNFTLKKFFKEKQRKGGKDKSSHISSPWLMNPSQLCSTGRENAPLVLSKDKHIGSHVTSQTLSDFLYFSQH